MKFPRRKFLHLAVGAVALPVLPRRASALDHPTRPVHLIISYPPGGSADMTARLTGQWLSERLGQQFIVESRPGAATNIATEAVVRAEPDNRLVALAEHYFQGDPNTCLLLRQFTELLAQDVAARASLFTSTEEPLVDLLGRLSRSG